MLQPKDRNVALIGMPGAGKSTVGHWLAERLGLRFIDTDLLIAEAAGKPLQAIIDTAGTDALRAIEAQVVSTLEVCGAVIATGGSVVYSAPAMNHLRALALVVHLESDPETLAGRIGDYAERGVVKRPDQSLADLFEERRRLYREYADVSVDTRGRTPTSVGEEICALLGRPS